MSKPRPPSREQKAEQKRELILHEALELFAARGYHATNIADIAARLDMGHGTFYRYFKNKHDIFIEVVNLVLRKTAVISQLQDPRAANSREDYRRQLVGIGETLLRLHCEDQRLSRVLFYEALAAGEEVRQTLEAARELTVQITAEYLRNGIAKGYLRPDLEVEVAARLLMAMVLESVRGVVQQPEPEAASKRWIDTIVGIILGGITKA